VTTRPATALALALSLLAVAARPASADSSTIERIVAVVNAEVVLLSELHEKSAQATGQLMEDTSPDGKRKQRLVLERMVDDVLVLQQATELKLTVEEAEVDRAIEEVKKSNNLDGEAFKQALSDQGYSMVAFRKDMRRQILRLKVINTAVRSRVNITDEEIKAFYEQSARQAGGHREAHVRHVLIAVPAGAAEREVDARRKLAARVLEEARGGADFAALARKHSDDAGTREDGGDLGWLKEGEGLSDAMNEVVFSMDQEHEVRGPVRTDRGFEVVQLLERKDGDVRPLADVKDTIRGQLYQQQLEKQTQSWVSELRKKAHIEVRL
jgi:peptidyl-prolyl cis-trans isomerase SurA